MFSSQHPFDDAPPAYAKLAELAKQHALLREKTVDLGYRGFEDYEEEEEEDLLMEAEELEFEAQELEVAMISTFIEAFTSEAAKGNFDIFANSSIQNMLEKGEVIANITKGPYYAQVFDKLADTELTETGAVRTLALVENFKAHLDEDKISIILGRIEAFSEILKGLKYSLASDAQQTMIRYIEAVRWSLITSEALSAAQISELSLLMVKKGRYDFRYLQNRIFSLAKQSIPFAHWEALGLSAAPLLVEKLNPDFFHQQIKAEGVDSKVVGLLLESWDGDFVSLIRSAKTLSAE